MTPDGIVKTDELDAKDKNEERNKSTRPLVSNIAIGVLLTLLIGQFVYSCLFTQGVLCNVGRLCLLSF